MKGDVDTERSLRLLIDQEQIYMGMMEVKQRENEADALIVAQISMI